MEPVPLLSSAPYTPPPYSAYRSPKRRRNPAGFGAVLLVVGAILLLNRLHLIPRLDLSVTWPAVLAVIGLTINIFRGFRSPAGWILMAIGGLHLIPEFSINGVPSRRLVWPAFLILAGLALLMRGRLRRPKPFIPSGAVEGTGQATRDFDLSVVFGGRREIITAKDFRGGSVLAVCGGAEINLMQSDIQPANGPAIIRCTTVMGGIELTVPAHYTVRNEIEPFMGSVEDKRVIGPGLPPEGGKTIVLRGSCVMGGVEIKSY